MTTINPGTCFHFPGGITSMYLDRHLISDHILYFGLRYQSEGRWWTCSYLPIHRDIAQRECSQAIAIGSGLVNEECLLAGREEERKLFDGKSRYFTIGFTEIALMMEEKSKPPIGHNYSSLFPCHIDEEFDYDSIFADRMIGKTEVSYEHN